MSDLQLPPTLDAALCFSDGAVFFGNGIGAKGLSSGEICFNTSLTGYQEVLSDPSYYGQIINFTFPHIGNIGTNLEDLESLLPVAKGLIVRNKLTYPSNFRNQESLDNWLQAHKLTGISGVDTRAITKYIRLKGAQNVAIFYGQPGQLINQQEIQETLKLTPDQNGLDLAAKVSCSKEYKWHEPLWRDPAKTAVFKVAVIDYGIKHNILRSLISSGCQVKIFPANATFEEILTYNPDGVMLSNGPGDPAATGAYAVPVINKILAAKIPLFAICLGHQMLAIAIGATTEKMPQGHRGANHPVKDLVTGRVEITSQNHGFVVNKTSIPARAKLTHISLFDNSVEGIALTDTPAFSVQYHPESSPGPHDSHYLFARFVDLMKTHSHKS